MLWGPRMSSPAASPHPSRHGSKRRWRTRTRPGVGLPPTSRGADHCLVAVGAQGDRLEREVRIWARVDSNHRRLTPTGLQPVPFVHSGTRPLQGSAARRLLPSEARLPAACRPAHPSLCSPPGAGRQAARQRRSAFREAGSAAAQRHTARAPCGEPSSPRRGRWAAVALLHAARLAKQAKARGLAGRTWSVALSPGAAGRPGCTARSGARREVVLGIGRLCGCEA